MGTANFDRYKDRLIWGYSTRKGGISTGIYESMNLSFNTGDSFVNVRKNYELWGESLGVDAHNMVLVKQTHTANVIPVDKSFRGEGLYKPWRTDYDGMVTREKGLALVTTHADCVPVYIFDPVKNAIAMVHAGWKGTVSEIPRRAVDTMVRFYGCDPSNMVAMIGPCISRKRFQCDSDVIVRVKEMLVDGSDQWNFDEEEGKYHVSLAGLNRLVLEDCGVPHENIDMNDQCTYDNEELYFSHRRQGRARGGQAALLMLKQD